MRNSTDANLFILPIIVFMYLEYRSEYPRVTTNITSNDCRQDPSMSVL